MNRALPGMASIWMLATLSCAIAQPAPGPTAQRTRVVLLGTGNPGLDPERAAAAFRTRGVEALDPVKITVAFLEVYGPRASGK